MSLPKEVCLSMYDGCMCELEAPHDGVDHQCTSPSHEPEHWTTEQGEAWLREVTS